MTGWNMFPCFALPFMLLWAGGAAVAWKGWRNAALTLTVSGTVLCFAFILMMWLSDGVPPLRTMGHTRLWYAFFLPVIGTMVYVRWGYRWILSFSTMMAVMFTCINLFKPEIHSQALVPALQSPWFAPHVIVYMFSYALLGAAAIMAVYILVRNGKENDSDYETCDNLVRTGLAFLTFGMLFGALWAKQAWGMCWSWDPKETWAAATWFMYLYYLHLRKSAPEDHRKAMWVILASFCCLQMCWWGISYLPSARGRSVHVY